MLAHALNNLAVVTATFMLGGRGESVDDLIAPWWMYVLSAAVFAGAMTALARQRPTGGGDSAGGASDGGAGFAVKGFGSE